ncbi:MAG: hypothetical protein H5U14_09855 [Roseovarius sp.]|nr:hypothetical protein [Roseovarius sp.]
MSEQMVRLEAVGYNPEWAAFVARAEVAEGPVRLVYPVQFRAPLTAEFAFVVRGLMDCARHLHRSGRADLRLRRVSDRPAPAWAA